MADYYIYALPEADITISGGAVLSGFDQGAASHLTIGQTITLNTNNWEQVFISDDGTDVNFADSDGSQQLDGAQTIFGTPYASGVSVEAEYTITVTAPDGTPYTLIGFNINEPGSPHPAYGTVEGLAFIGDFPPVGETLTISGVGEGPANSGGAATPATTYAEPPCFAPQTHILTPDGPRAAGALRPGDLVCTLDHGPRPVRWLSHSTVPLDGRGEDAKPILVHAHAIAPGCPARDLVVSAQHRLLVGGRSQFPALAAQESLVPAKALTGLPGIRVMHGRKTAHWVHFALARHEVVRAEGCLAESLLLGPMVLQGVPAQDRNALEAFFRGAAGTGQPLNGAPARPVLPVGTVRKRVWAHHRADARQAA